MKLVAGREMDALVAERVMGLKPCVFRVTGLFSAWATTWMCEHETTKNCFPSNPEAAEHVHSVLERYSTNTNAAWVVLDHLAHTGHWDATVHSDPCREFYRVDLHAGDINCPHKRPYNPEDGHGNSDVMDWDGESVPEAICRAALKAVGVKLEGKED